MSGMAVNVEPIAPDVTLFPNRAALMRAIPSGGVGAELGVWKGDFAAVILRSNKPQKLHLVDSWGAGSASGPLGVVDGKRQLLPISWDEMQQSVVRRFAARQEVVIHAQDSLAWLRRQPGQSLDWVYLDTLHTFQRVLNELREARRLVRPGGYLCGHDYSAAFPGVIVAVDVFCRQFGLQVSLLTTESKHPILDQQHYSPAEAAFDSFAIRV